MRRTTGRFLRNLALLALAAAALGAPALAQESEEAFTRRMAERFRAALPDRPITIGEPLQLFVGAGPDPAEVNVGRIFNYCRTSGAEACETSIATFVASSVDAVGDAEAPIARERLRVAVRSADYCDYIASEPRFREKSRSGPLHRPFAAGLCTLIMADFPTTARSVSIEDLEKLGLEADAAWALAQRQTLADFPEPQGLDGLGDGIVLVSGFDYAPSLILNGEGWRAAAAKHGELLAAIPADNAMVVVRAAKATDLPRLKAAVRDHFDTAERGVSPRLYRWTEKGWVALPE